MLNWPRLWKHGRLPDQHGGALTRFSGDAYQSCLLKPRQTITTGVLRNMEKVQRLGREFYWLPSVHAVQPADGERDI